MNPGPVAAVRKRTLSAYLLLTAVTLVWGTTFPLVKAALRELPPFTFNLLRMSLASVLLLAANGRRLRGLTGPQLRLCVMAGVFLALGYELQTLGLVFTTPSKSAFLTGLVVILVPLLSLVPVLHIQGSPRPRPIAYLGAFSALVGIVLLTSQPGSGASLLSGLHLGEWLTLGCAVAFAIHLLTLARAAWIPARVLGTMQIACCTAVMVLFLPFDRHKPLHWSPRVYVALAVTSIFATAAAFTIQSWVQQHLPASHTALILTLEPVFAWILSLLFLGEHLGPRALTGAGLILAGILLAELGPTVLSQAGILPLEP